VGLDDTLRMLRGQSPELRLATAQVAAATGDLRAAKAVQSPNFSFWLGSGPVPATPPGPSVSVQAQLDDGGLALDALFGKRAARARVAARGLDVAHAEQRDVLRLLEGAVKQQYVEVVLAKATIEFARAVQQTFTEALELNRRRYPGSIDAGALSRIEVAKLAADRDVDLAVKAHRVAEIELLRLLGWTDAPPHLDVDETWLKLVVPPRLASATEEGLLSLARANRPDLASATAGVARAGAALQLAERSRAPTTLLGVQYMQYGGPRAADLGPTPPTLSFGVTTSLPFFYQQQGEIGRATAEVDARAALKARRLADVTAEVGQAWAAFVAQRAVVGRDDRETIPSARTARDTVDMQFRAGSATLMDFLDAQRTWVATNLQFLDDLGNYWEAVFQLEQAVGSELR
jgi:cobalt-zinc-cadmium efflux system outer membrane protein